MSNFPYIRLIGDVHGRISRPPKVRQRNVRDQFPRSPYQAREDQRRTYLGLIQQCTYSIQVGDLGLDYSQLSAVDPAFHRVIAGNHDNLPELSPHFLGDFGTHSIPLRSSAFDLFFVRGAQSIDIGSRTEGLNWWPHEELTDAQMEAAWGAYRSSKPQLVISHDCPTELVSHVATIATCFEPSRTNALLQTCLMEHAPSLWIFGHHHRNWSYQHPCGTKFVCLGPLSYFDFNENGAPLYDMPR
jgi:hypothetical protein